MSATFAYEDPLSRASEKLVGTKAQTMFIFKEMGRNMWSSGKGFAKVGALYSGYECCIEGVSTEIYGHALCRHLLTISSLTTVLPFCLSPFPLLYAVPSKERHLQLGSRRFPRRSDPFPIRRDKSCDRGRGCVCGVLGGDRPVDTEAACRVSRVLTHGSSTSSLGLEKQLLLRVRLADRLGLLYCDVLLQGGLKN
jgi:hypothetical protein